MTTERRLETDLFAILDSLATGPYPDYIDDVLATTAHRRQRPAWTFPERWLPMDSVMPQGSIPMRGPWRQVAVLALLAALSALAVAAYIGSRPRAPEPFGPAANGLLVYSDHGDIFTREGTNGAPRLVVGGQDDDQVVGFSRQGTDLLFARVSPGAATTSLWVVSPDGTAARQLDGEYRLITGVEWSPLGDVVAVSHTVGGVGVITLVPADGGQATTLDIGVHATEAIWRPGEGDQLSFRGKDGTGWGQFIVARDGTGLTRLALLTERMFETEYDVRGARWSDDGRRLLYDSLHTVGVGNGSGLRIHMADIDPHGSVLSDARFDFEASADDELNARWLQDERFVYQRRLGNEEVGIRDSLRVGFVAGSTGQSIKLGIESVGDQGIGYEVSPDGAELVAITWTEGATFRSDLTTYSSTVASFSSDSGAIWQRVAVP